MSHSLTKIWVHGVFSTKGRAPLINSKLEPLLYNHIKELLINRNNCFVKIINGTSDHTHILFFLNPNYSIQEIFHNIKGESSHWINQMDLLKIKFAWQTGYGAFSVSESKIATVERYIACQKEHHRNKSFTDEYNQLLNKYKIEIINRSTGLN